MNSALLVIDVQNIYTNPQSEMYCHNSKLTIKKINLLIESFSQLNEPIVYVKHVHNRNGNDLGRMFDYAGPTNEFNFIEGSMVVEYDPNLKFIPGSYEVRKNRYSSFTNTQLDKFLKEKKIDKVVICGFMTSFCCESTARDAHGLDYYVDFVIDATGTPSLSDKLSQTEIRAIVSEFLNAGFANVCKTKEFLSNQLYASII
ncbi:MAG: cysteine hydrolase family protein [Clostridiales bacterium]|jgi:ureidoacrylate peracid hydrolase